MEDYNSSGLFTWNTPNTQCAVSETNVYKDVLIHTGTRKKGEWENSIAVIESTREVVSNSNHFLHCRDWGNWYNVRYNIYSNIIRNYAETGTKSVDISLQPGPMYFYMLSAFSFSNSGHNLSEMLNCVAYLCSHSDIRHVIIPQGYWDTHNGRILRLVLPDDCVFYEVPFCMLVRVPAVIILHPVHFNITKYMSLVNRITDQITTKYCALYSEWHGKRVILMKTMCNKNVMLSYTQFKCDTLIDCLIGCGFIYVIPEEMDVFQLAVCLMTADHIVYSTGSILYTNQIFFNPNAKFTYMYLKGTPLRNGCEVMPFLSSTNPRYTCIWADLNLDEAEPEALDEIIQTITVGTSNNGI